MTQPITRPAEASVSVFCQVEKALREQLGPRLVNQSQLNALIAKVAELERLYLDLQPEDTTPTTTKPLTAAQRRALEILRDKGPLRPREFSRWMWPDNIAHQATGKCGAHGVTRGTGMHLAGGAYLGKLSKAGLVSYDVRARSYVPSAAGRAALEAPTG